jgi:uncharacterized protein
MTPKAVSLLIMCSLWLASCNTPPATLPLVISPAISTFNFMPAVNQPPETSITTTPHTMPPCTPAFEQQALDATLIQAAEQGDTESVKQLLEQGASIEMQDEKGRTALIAAAYRNDLLMADLLIQAGADVNKQDNTKQSAYLIATSEGYLELLKLTLQAGADVHSTDSYNGTGLIRAADCGHVEIIQELLKTDINIDHINNLGWTALLEAIILGDGGTRHT